MDRPLTTLDTARSLVASPLWPRIRDFLWNFAPRIHPSHLASLPAVPGVPDVSALPPSPRLSRWLLAQLGVEPCFHTFPPSDDSRLLLLDTPTLQSIANWLGALATADALRRVTRAPDVAALKVALPGIYPSLFTYIPYFSKSPLLNTAADPTPSAIQTLGLSLLRAHLSHLPPPLLHRLNLMLPSDAPPPSTPTPQKSNNPTIQRSNGQTVKRSNDPTIQRFNDSTLPLLLKLKFPEAHALCSS